MTILKMFDMSPHTLTSENFNIEFGQMSMVGQMSDYPEQTR